MSINSIEVIGNRIKVATPESKIAVFIVRVGSQAQLDAVFDAPRITQKRKEYEKHNYVGSFDMTEIKTFKAVVKKALENSRVKGLM